MLREPKVSWDEETMTASCELYDCDSGLTFIGVAICSPTDADMVSKRTGWQLAADRAQLEYYLYLRDYEIIPALKTLKDVYYSMCTSKKFNPDSYEAKRVKKKLENKEDDLKLIRMNIKDTRKRITYFISEKDLLYKKIRDNRKRAIKDSSN